MEDDAQSQVVNFDKLQTLREEIADLYAIKRIGDRVDRSKILIGTGRLTFDSEEHIREMAECGIDFVIHADNKASFDLLHKYGIGVINRVYQFDMPYFQAYASHSDREEQVKSGLYAPTFDEAYLREALPEISAFDHEAIWGIDIVDEPVGTYFSFYEMQRSVMQEKYPHLNMFINLFPHTDHYSLGVEKGSDFDEYSDYIDNYVKTVDTDYICYDRYMYGEDGSNIEDMFRDTMIISKACRESNRDFWMWLQVNFPVDNGTALSVDQLKFQANLVMAMGVTNVIWACWNPWWWYNNVYDSQGNKTEQYDKLKEVNSEINTLSPVIIKYKCLDNNIIGYKHPDHTYFHQYDDNVIESDTFTEVSMAKYSKNSVFCGYFEKKIGDGSAMMFVNITDPDCETKESATVFFKVSAENAIVTEHTACGSFVIEPNDDGYYEIQVENAEYAFVTVE